MTTNVNIIKVGNSNGIIIPSSFLKALCLKEKDRVEISESNGILSLRKVEELGETPFSFLDRWNDEHGYSDTFEDVNETLKVIRSSREDKEIIVW